MPPDANSNNFEPSKPQKWWQRMPKRPIIIGGAVILLLIIAIVALSSGGDDKNANKQADSSSVYYDRPGIDRSKLTNGIGDPAALVLQANATPVTYEGIKVIQACNVFDLNDIKETGLVLQPHNQPVPFERNYFDGKGKGTLRTGDYDFTLQPVYGEESNNCLYNLWAGQEEPRLWIQVLQTPYSHPVALDGELKKYQPIGTIGGLQAYQTTSEGVVKSIVTILRSGSSAVRIDTDLKDTTKLQAVLEKVAANFSRLLTAPDGPAKVTYKSPLTPEGGVNACDILLPSDIKLTFNAETNPVATEAAASGVGVIRASENSPQYNYIATECTRTAVRPPLVTNIQAITATVTTYRDQTGAKADTDFKKARDKSVKPTTPTVGNDSFLSRGLLGNEDKLVVRKDNVVMEFTTSAKDKTTADLLPAAQAVVNRL